MNPLCYTMYIATYIIHAVQFITEPAVKCNSLIHLHVHVRIYTCTHSQTYTHTHSPPTHATSHFRDDRVLSPAEGLRSQHSGQPGGALPPGRARDRS